MEFVELFLISLSVFLPICIYCPVVLYGLRTYYVRQHHFVYTLRYSQITVIQAIIMVIKLLYDSFYMVSSTFLFGYHSTENKIVLAINAYIAAFFLYAFVWKFWLLRYNIMLNVIVLNANWKSIINPQENKQINSSFYVKHRKTFGDQKFTMIICIIIAVVLTSIYVITILMDLYGDEDNSYVTQLYSSWDYIIPYILLILLYKAQGFFC